MKTKAVVFPKANKFEVRELTLPKPGPNDIVVRTVVSAISPGTERWILRGKHIGTEFPNVPGYHRIGVVERRGKNVKVFEEGDYVYGFAGSWKEKVKPMWGAHVGMSVSPPDGYWFVSSSRPGDFALDTMAFTVLSSVGTRGVKACDIQPTQKILIVGGGIIGITVAQLSALRLANAVVLDKDPARVAHLKPLLPNVLNVDDKSLESKLRKIAPDGFDVLYDTVGHAATTDRLVPLTRQRGTILLQAQYFDKEKCALDLDAIKIREQTIRTTIGIDDDDWFETKRDILARRIQIAPLITHRFRAPDELTKGYDLIHKGKPHNLGIVFRWD